MSTEVILKYFNDLTRRKRGLLRGNLSGGDLKFKDIFTILYMIQKFATLIYYHCMHTVL